MGIWDAIKGLFVQALELLHTGLEPWFGVHAWGWSIIVLTLIVRVFLLPLAVKQTRSMRAMQAMQPKIKELQKKHKVDKELMRKDPETYKARKQKLNEETMAMYKEEGVNPASGCLPLLLQAPIFFALFQVLRDFDSIRDAPFYFFTAFVGNEEHGAGLGAFVRDTGWPGWFLIVLMAATMFWSQRQMMARNSGAMEGPAAQQQKIMMYIMPVFLAFISQSFPMGVLLYWVTTNFWQMGQQAVILREVQHDLDEASVPGAMDGGGKGRGTTPSGKAKGSGSTASKGNGSKGKDDGKAKGNGKAKGSDAKGTAKPSKPKGPAKPAQKQSPPSSRKKRDHLPKRGDATQR